VTAYRRLVQLTASVTIVLGIAIVAVTLANGVGVGLLIGALFVAAGVGRLVMLRRRTRR
jgi:Flp pilus assembly protein TadB